jgi:hypothetical protein
MYKRAPNITQTYRQELTNAATQQLNRCLIASNKYATASTAAVISTQLVERHALASWTDNSPITAAPSPA